VLTKNEDLELLGLLHVEERRLLDRYFPDTGPLRRALYARHLEFFAAGSSHRERLFLAANRTGKSDSGAYELALHLTGQYPAWWQGRRFPRPIRAWAAGDTSDTVREILQRKLCGAPSAWGTGLIPGAALRTPAPRSEDGAVDSLRVDHVSGGLSQLWFKTYSQGRATFQGDQVDVILLDEEAPLGIHTECLLRTMTTNGLLMLTFTPLQGLSELVLQFLPDGQLPEGAQTGSKYVVNAGWDDVPHLDEAAKAELRKSIPPYQLDARTRGLPVLGAGVIYPVEEDAYLVDPFALPPHWRRAYALDVGWNRTAALWGAYDADTDVWTLYDEYYRGQAEPSIHATAIRARGEWIPGVIDPAARGRSQRDGHQLLQDYIDLGLQLEVANNAVEAGIYQVWERLSTGRLKGFKSLSHWRKEMRLYRRDEKGNIVKKDDHLMDDTRYIVMSGLDVARAVPVAAEPERDARLLRTGGHTTTGWMR
jgi:phage terminase large subunit-like protein